MANNIVKDCKNCAELAEQLRVTTDLLESTTNVLSVVLFQYAKMRSIILCVRYAQEASEKTWAELLNEMDEVLK